MALTKATIVSELTKDNVFTATDITRLVQELPVDGGGEATLADISKQLMNQTILTPLEVSRLLTGK